MIRSSLDRTRTSRVRPEEVLDALCNDASRKVLASCTGEPRPVQEICERTGLPSATAYRHVNDLVDRGLLERVRSAVSQHGQRYGLYRSRFDAIRLSIDEDGVELSWDGPDGDG